MQPRSFKKIILQTLFVTKMMFFVIVLHKRQHKKIKVYGSSNYTLGGR